MLAVNAASLRHHAPNNPMPVEVFVCDSSVHTDLSDGWYPGVLVEWALYEEHGWTGYVRYRTGVAEQFAGRFTSPNIRPCAEPPARSTEPRDDAR